MSEGSTGIDNNIVVKKITLSKSASGSRSFGAYVPPAPELTQDAINPANPKSKFSFDTTVPYIAPTEDFLTMKDPELKPVEQVQPNIELSTDSRLSKENEKRVIPDLPTLMNLQMSYVSLEQQLHEPLEKAQEVTQAQTDSLQPTVEQETVEEERMWMLLQKQHTNYVDGIRYIYITEWWAYSHPGLLQVNREIMQSNNDRLHAINTNLVDQEIAYVYLYSKDLKALPTDQSTTALNKFEDIKRQSETILIPGKPRPWGLPIPNNQTVADEQFVLPEVLKTLEGKALEDLIAAMAKAEGVENTQKILQSLGKNVTPEKIEEYIVEHEKIAQRSTEESEKEIANLLKLKEKENPTVDSIALIKRNLLILGKIMMLFKLITNGNVRFSGKELGLPHDPPEGKSDETWTTIVSQIEEMKDVEFTTLLSKSLDLVNNNAPMK